MTAYSLLALLLLPGLFSSVKWNSLTRANTRIEEKNWLIANVRPSEVVYSFDHHLDMPLSVNAARWHHDVNGVDASAKINYIVANPAAFAGRGIDLFYDFYRNRYDALGGPATKYIVIFYWKKEQGEKQINEIMKYHSIQLVQSFYPTTDEILRENGIDDYLNNPTKITTLWKLDKSGPFVEIYQIL